MLAILIQPKPSNGLVENRTHFGYDETVAAGQPRAYTTDPVDKTE
jgi:hypothetical protein